MRHSRSVLLWGIIVITMFASCSPRIVGVWNIDRYEVKERNKAPLIVNNIGTLRFTKDGYGKKNVAYSIFQHQYSSSSMFKWNIIDNKMVRIDDESPDFNKGWLIVKNSKRVQVWKSTGGNDKTQIIKLVKL